MMCGLNEVGFYNIVHLRTSEKTRNLVLTLVIAKSGFYTCAFLGDLN